MFLLLALAVIGYERRIHPSAVESASSIQPKPSPSVVKTVDDE
jgi:hypothetical protein